MRDPAYPRYRIGAEDVRAARPVDDEERLLEERAGESLTARELDEILEDAGRDASIEHAERVGVPSAVALHQLG